MTWDETPHERMTFMARNFSKDELTNQDLRDYVASDTDSDGMLLLHVVVVFIFPFLEKLLSRLMC